MRWPSSCWDSTKRWARLSTHGTTIRGCCLTPSAYPSASARARRCGRYEARHRRSSRRGSQIPALDGQFAGGQESLAVGASAGTAGLYGGRRNEIILESVAITQKKSGLNFADGVAEMTLKP